LFWFGLVFRVGGRVLWVVVLVGLVVWVCLLFCLGLMVCCVLVCLFCLYGFAVLWVLL